MTTSLRAAALPRLPGPGRPGGLRRRLRPTAPAPGARCRSRRRSTRCSTSPSGSAATTCEVTEPHQARRRAARPRAHRRGTVAAVARADLVVYLQGFQPAVDEAVASQAAEAAARRRRAATLDLAAAPDGRGPEHGPAPVTRERRPTRTSGSTRCGSPPWPTRSPTSWRSVDPDATRPTTQPARRPSPPSWPPSTRSSPRGLADCAQHAIWSPATTAFGYLARRYGLTRSGITGLTPDAEPSPAAPGPDRRDLVKDDGVTHGLLRDAGQPASRRDPGPRDRARGGRARPARGPDRRVRRRGLLRRDARQPRRPCAPARSAREHGGRHPPDRPSSVIALGRAFGYAERSSCATST